ncbi:hypothetical protein [Halobacterium litoreum]|uniref:PGF-CTERM protein n=1 Tax=Halobacterium litoreum TaxID=2039234 RepID=A0ABD5NIL1_9EURY|nr:hypothetical protein [Halobacterium litoreum]UHH12428.1 hypothetical protein LT972_09690 [Halobacterium litoreum]
MNRLPGVARSLLVAALAVSLALAGSATAGDGPNLAHPAPDDDTTTTDDPGAATSSGSPTRVAVDDGVSDAVIVGGGFLAGGLLVGFGVTLGRWLR